MEYGCIGKKLGHSFSRLIHERLADYAYELCEVPEEELEAFMRRADFKAINVTIPYKERVIPFLDEISDTAREIGAVNTVVRREGRLYGYNTDLAGMTALFRRRGLSFTGEKVLVLGSGGTSKTAVCAAKRMGAAQVVRVSRTAREDAVTYAQAKERHSDARLLINTTPCGMYPAIGEAAVELADYSRLTGVVDAVYNPLRSALVVEAQRQGLNAEGGLYMLVAQAAYAAEKFIGRPVSETEIETIYADLAAQKRNLVLIGMPGSGKTTLGRMTAKKLGKTFFDSDAELTRQTGYTPAQLIEQAGEAEFRRLEAQVVARLAAEQGAVIATGGGVILNEENMRLLRENGLTVFVDRPLEHLAVTADRPLSSTRELLRHRYEERYERYCQAADATLKAVADRAENVRALTELFRRGWPESQGQEGERTE